MLFALLQLPTLSIWVAPEVNAPKMEWQSLLGPLVRLNVYPREFVITSLTRQLGQYADVEQPEIWRTYFSKPTERKVDDIDANKNNLRFSLNGLQASSSIKSPETNLMRRRPNYSPSSTRSCGHHRQLGRRYWTTWRWSPVSIRSVRE